MKQAYKHSYKAEDNILNSLSVFNVGHQKCEPGYQWGPGIRNHYSIHHIISGAGCYVVNNMTYELKAGDTFILFPNTQVRYFADDKHPWEYAWVGFMGNDAGSILASTDFSKEHPVIQQMIPSLFIRKQLAKIYELRGNNYENAVAMTGTLYTLLSIFMHYAIKKQEKGKDLTLVYVEKAMDFIATSYSYPITIEEIAKYVGISRSHLFRSFQKHLQTSPKEYLSTFRIKQGCRLLKETDLPIGTIAYSVGFDNNLYFSKAFKHHMDVTPSGYRKI
ncbi:AraC family transcriptional regulator [Lachnospiraceae bacterium ZAX-1]